MDPQWVGDEQPRKDPEDILDAASYSGLVESFPLIRFPLKEAIVSLGMPLLTAQAYFSATAEECVPLKRPLEGATQPSRLLGHFNKISEGG